MGTLTVTLPGIELAAGTITLTASLQRHRDATSPIAVSKLETGYSVTYLTGRDEFRRGAATKINENPMLGYGYMVEGKIWIGQDGMIPASLMEWYGAGVAAQGRLSEMEAVKSMAREDSVPPRGIARDA